MTERFYDITLLSDVALTEDGATVGGHSGQDYLRGALFLGVVASRMNKDFDAELLLSGKVRFLNAYPLVKNEIAYPIPLSFHKVKGEDWVDHFPSTSPEEEPEKQFKQWRSGYVTPSGTVIEIPLKSRMKTAVDRTRRSSREGQLFGYQAIPEGTKFRMSVQTDTEEDLTKIDALFAQQKEIFLGRSRFAEYGAASISPCECKGGSPATESISMKGQLFLYLASDMALCREGTVTLLPEARDFGLEGAKFVPEKSFMRTRYYSPWNSFFNCRMEDRQVLSKGSVLVFRTDKMPDLAALQEKLSAGVGLYVQEGLGQVLVNPSWLIEPPKLTKPSEQKVSQAAEPKTPLITFLKRTLSFKKDGEESLSLGLAWAREWKRLSDALEKDGQDIPTKSQWSAIRDFALRFSQNPEKLRSELKEFCCKDLRKKLWEDAQIMRGGKHMSIYSEMTKKLDEHPNLVGMLALHHAAIEMGRLLARSDSDTKEEKNA